MIKGIKPIKVYNVPDGFYPTAISGRYKKSLSDLHTLFVEDLNRTNYVDTNRIPKEKRFRVHVQSDCGWTSTVRYFSTITKAFKFAKTITEENFEEKL